VKFESAGEMRGTAPRSTESPSPCTLLFEDDKSNAEWLFGALSWVAGTIGEAEGLSSVGSSGNGFEYR
jgi:hypothetical protein